MLHCFTRSQLSVLCSFSQVNPSSCSCLVLFLLTSGVWTQGKRSREVGVRAQPAVLELVTGLGVLLLKHSPWQLQRRAFPSRPGSWGWPRGRVWLWASPDAAWQRQPARAEAPTLPAAVGWGSSQALRQRLGWPLAASPGDPARVSVVACDAFVSAARFLVACVCSQAQGSVACAWDLCRDSYKKQSQAVSECRSFCCLHSKS